MTRFAILSFLGLSALCAIGFIDQASAQNVPLIDVNVLSEVLNTIVSPGGGRGIGIRGTSGRPSLLNINLMVQLLNGLLPGGNSSIVSTTILTDVCNQASIRPPASSGNNTNSLIAIRITIELLNTIGNTGNATNTADGSSGSDGLLSINAIVSLLNSIAGRGGNISTPGGNTTRPLIGIDVLLQALNNYIFSSPGSGNRYVNIGQLNELLQLEANNAGGNSGVGSVLNVDNILPILNQAIYEPNDNSATTPSLIRVNVLIDTLSQLLGGIGGKHGVYTANDALVSIDVGISLLNSSPRVGGGLVGLIINLLRGLLSALLSGQGGILGGILGGPGGLGGVLNGLLGRLLG